jgi:hypothetical protein
MKKKTANPKPAKKPALKTRRKFPLGKPKNNGKHPGGRPVKWTPDAIRAEGEALVAWMLADKAHLFFQTFTQTRGYAMCNFTIWEKESIEFLASVSRAKDIQAERLMLGAVIREQPVGGGENGMGGFTNPNMQERFNPSLVRFLLSCNHGMKETTAQEVSGPNGGPQQHNVSMIDAPKRESVDEWMRRHCQKTVKP